MADEEVPIASPPAGPPPLRSRRRYARWLGGGAALLVLLAAIAVGVLVWALRTAAGSAWVVTLAPQLKVVAPRGSLLGDFSAERIDITLPGSSGVLRLDAPRWQALEASRGTAGRWLRLTIASLHADRVSLLPGEAAPTEPTAATPPETLRLPVEIDIREASVGELRIGAGDDAFALRALRGRVHLGAEGGTLHRFAALQASHARASASGDATVGADPPFAIDAKVSAASAGTTPPWQASASASGPLATLAVAATARVAPATAQAAQSLDAKAVVQPFAAWPLGELQASTEALDLSAFASGAPATSLSGRATATTSGLDRPALIALDLRNARAGRWNEGLLPVQRLAAELRARPDDPGTIEVQGLTAELGSSRLGGGRIAGGGRWTADRWNVELALDQLRPSALDARAPETTVDGKLDALGTGFAAGTAAEAAKVELRADLVGRLADRRLPRSAPQTARIRLEASGGAREILLRSAEASLGAARATLAGRLSRTGADAPWRASGKASLVEFDPAPWWPGATDSLLARGVNRLNMKGEFELDLPSASAGSAFQLLAATRGKATLVLAESLLAGVPLQGEASYANSNGDVRSSLELLAAGNRLHAQGQLAAKPAQDAWQVSIDARQLARLAPWLETPRKGAASAPPTVAGTLTASGRIEGRWPDLRSDGELQAAALRLGALSVRRGEGRWRLGSTADAPMSGTLALDGVDLAGRAIERVRAELSGTARAHKADLRIESNALPPEWIDTIATQRAAAAPPAASPASAAIGAAAPPAAPNGSRSIVVMRLEGGLVDAGGEHAAGWSGTVHELLAQSLAPPARTWLRAQGLRGSYFWSGGPQRASLEPGSAEALGATMRWSKAAWQAGDVRGGGARLDASATIDPLPIAPLLRAIQPDFGWGGDLALQGRLEAHGAPSVRVDAVVERASGDLDVTDEYGTQRLGLTDLRLGIAADDGVWRLTAALAGESLGVASGAVTARTSPTAAWPEASTPVEGVLEVRVANLGTWGRWVPAGWRLTGEMHASASIGGRFGAPEYTGRIEGAHLGVRNFLQGVNIKDGSVAIALQGSSARIEKFTARGGNGSLSLEGEASFDEAPAARLKLAADRFEILGRVDRRIVTSGNASLRLDATTLALEGRFGVDEGLVDFSHSDAPSLGDDVEVVRRPTGAPAAATAAAGAASATAATSTAAAPVPALPPSRRKVDLDLRVAMGEKLRVRGRGLDAGLRGELHITSPSSRLSVDGSLRAVNGTYQAYGQKLAIDRGELTFVGPIENPRLDIEATRPNLDVRVGVQVAGPALSPRVRLFSEPDMSDIDKLSWLLLGRASETTGGADTALLQRAALALLAGEGTGPTEQITQAIGLDEISVRQQTEGDTKETIVKVGKQLSKDWYIGYERGLNATAGSWQLIYRLARQLTVRAQAGGDNSLDLIWTLRWK